MLFSSTWSVHEECKKTLRVMDEISYVWWRNRTISLVEKESIPGENAKIRAVFCRQVAGGKRCMGVCCNFEAVGPYNIGNNPVNAVVPDFDSMPHASSPTVWSFCWLIASYAVIAAATYMEAP